MRKKSVILLSFALLSLLLLSTSVMAQRENIFERVFDVLVNIFSLDFLENDEAKLAAFLRGIIWLTVFTVIFNVVRRLGARGAGMFNQGSSIVLAGVFATLTTMFLPPDLLIALGEGYTTLMAGVLVGIMALIVLVVLYQVLPGMGLTGRVLHLTRILFLVLLLYLLDNISGFVSAKFSAAVLVPALAPLKVPFSVNLSKMKRFALTKWR